MKKRGILLCMVMLMALPAIMFAKKPDSKFNGVQIGTITYSYRDMPGQTLPDILNYVVASGINSVELMGGAVEEYAGCPKNADNNTVRQWRETVSMDKFKEIKKMFDQKGVKIHILKLGNPGWSDAELDYAFKACKVLGAKGISMEIGDEAAKRIAPFAEKHNSYLIFHNHMQPGEPGFSFEHFLDYSPNIMLNFDTGHYFGSTGIEPQNLIAKLQGRIFSIHVKDKTSKTAAQPNENRSFGQGDTPVVEMLRFIRDNKWPIYCDIELEYEVPGNSDAVKEVIKCVEYCKNALEN